MEIRPIWRYVGCCGLPLLLWMTVAAMAESPADLLGFADSLFQEGDYALAIGEYQRYISLYPNSAEAISVHFRIAAAHRNAGAYAEARRVYEQIREAYPAAAPYAEIEVAETELLAGNLASAQQSLASLLGGDVPAELRERAGFLDALTEMELRHWDRMASRLDELTAARPASDFTRLAARLALLNRKATHLKSRSPGTSALLSGLVPGLGQAYNGYWQHALRSFVWVGGLAGFATYYLAEKRYRVGIPLACVALLEHVSNIRQGWHAVEAHNETEQRQLLEPMRAMIRQSGVFRPQPIWLPATPSRPPSP